MKRKITKKMQSLYVHFVSTIWRIFLRVRFSSYKRTWTYFCLPTKIQEIGGTGNSSFSNIQLRTQLQSSNHTPPRMESKYLTLTIMRKIDYQTPPKFAGKQKFNWLALICTRVKVCTMELWVLSGTLCLTNHTVQILVIFHYMFWWNFCNILACLSQKQWRKWYQLCHRKFDASIRVVSRNPFRFHFVMQKQYIHFKDKMQAMFNQINHQIQFNE